MDNSLQVLCQTLKSIIPSLKPNQDSISLTLLLGKAKQGKRNLLQQTALQHIAINHNGNIHLYYNDNGIIISLCETWLSQSNSLLQTVIKKINTCHRTIKITGLILCIDINELLVTDPSKLLEDLKKHSQLISRFQFSYPIPVSIIINKLDTIAGFSEFYQHEHEAELKKSLGFSLDKAQTEDSTQFKKQYDRFIESLEQQVIHKIHPERSNIKRTLIREFPLQLVSARLGVQLLVQAISNQVTQVNSVYFTSSQQGDVSIDHLNQKIQQEFALVTQEQFPQSTNYRAYFIEGALHTFQEQTKNIEPPKHVSNQHIKKFVAITISITSLMIGYHYYKSIGVLDKTSKELLAYDRLDNKSDDPAASLYHLNKASTALAKLDQAASSPASIQKLTTLLEQKNKDQFRETFTPLILNQLEHVILSDNQPLNERYDALKVYLMLGDKQHYVKSEVVNWFSNYWATNTSDQSVSERLALLQTLDEHALVPLPVNQQFIVDIRNYFNALPEGYFYYNLAKNKFKQTASPISINGFNLAEKAIPDYFTKTGFQETINALPNIMNQFKDEHWVLQKQPSNQLQELLEQAYCYDYTLWWKNFMKRTAVEHVQNYQEASQLINVIHKKHSFHKLVELIQKQTAPDLDNINSRFNQEIAKKFTSISLINQSTTEPIDKTLVDLETLLKTLSVVGNEGETAFSITQARFRNTRSTDPLTMTFEQAEQSPKPISPWLETLANNIWVLLITDTKAYINQQWQKNVYSEYQTFIANRFPLSVSDKQEINLTDFNHFFSPNGLLNQFAQEYIEPFLNKSLAQWQPKELNGYELPFSTDTINELMRANVIRSMFFKPENNMSQIEFSLQKISLDPVVASISFSIGSVGLMNAQDDPGETATFQWPQANANLSLKLVGGNQYKLEEQGPWAFFKLLKKVNVLADKNNPNNLQILFEINGNSGLYLLKTTSRLNPFTPGILNEFHLNETIT